MTTIQELKDRINEILPKDSEVTKIEMEGPEIAIYTANPKAFFENEAIVSQTAHELKKRINIRTDKCLLQEPEVVREKLETIIPKEAEVKDVSFNPCFSEVVIESIKPGLVIGKQGETSKKIILETGWTPEIIRSPTQKSDILRGIRSHLNKYSKERKDILKEVSKKIYAEIPENANEWIRTISLGGYQEVGRSSTLIETPTTKILFDCGINVASHQEPYPYMDVLHFPMSEIDAVVISHAHMDHCLPPNTPVKLGNGKSVEIKDVKEGDIVQSFDWKKKKFITATCIGKTITKNHSHIYKINTPHYSIEASPNHRLFTVDGLEVKEVEAQEMKKGNMVPAFIENNENGFGEEKIELVPGEFKERIVLPKEAKNYLKQARKKKKMPQTKCSELLGTGKHFIQNMESKYNQIHTGYLDKVLDLYEIDKNSFYIKFNIKQTSFPKTINSRLAQCLAYIAGDGHLGSPYSLRMTDESVECLKEYQKLFTELFKTKVYITHHSDQSKNAHILKVDNRGVVDFFEKNFKEIFNKSQTTCVPKSVLKENKEIFKGFLRGIADAEGSVADNNLTVCSSSNPHFLEQIQYLCSSVGVLSHISYTDNKIKVSSAEGINAFKNYVGFSHPKKSEKLEKLVKKMQSKTSRYGANVPINSLDLNNILNDAGMLGRIHHSPKIKEMLPLAILDWHNTKNKERYAEQKTVEQLIALLEKRVGELNRLKNSNSVWKKRCLLSISRATLNKSLNIGISQIQRREEKNLQDNLYKKLNQHLNKLICQTITKTEDNIKKIRYLMELPVVWQKITKIEKSKNPHPYLVDIEVSPTKNFIANNVIVHNSGFLPYLFKLGYKGPVYSTQPTRDLMTLLHFDYIDVLVKEGKEPIYSEKDVKEMLKYCIPRNYREVTDIAPDMRLTLHNAAHILGSASVHLHIGEGAHNLVYSGDIKYGFVRLFDNIDLNYPRLETLILESTYGGKKDIQPNRQKSEIVLSNIINETVESGGNVLIPVFAVGRGQEIMLVIENFYKRKMFTGKCYVDGMTSEASAIHTAYPEYLREHVKRSILQNNSPFASDVFEVVKYEERDKILEEKGNIIMASSGMLTGGPSLEYFKKMADDERNTLVFVGYQGEGSLGSRLQKGMDSMPISENGKTKKLDIKMKIATAEGFSGHADKNQLINYVKRLKPKPRRIIVNHGNKVKCAGMSQFLQSRMRIKSVSPQNLDALRLK